MGGKLCFAAWLLIFFFLPLFVCVVKQKMPSSFRIYSVNVQNRQRGKESFLEVEQANVKTH